MNLFTNDDYRRILAWLKANAITDSQLENADLLSADDFLAIVLNNTNKKVNMNDLISQLLPLIDDGTITTNLLADSVITEPKIADSAVSTDKIANNSISGNKLKSACITEDKISNASISANKIKSNAIQTNHIADDSVTTDKINSSAITTDKINDYSVTANKISNGAVNESKIANDSISNDKLLDNSVTSDKILNASINSSHIVNNTIKTEHILNGAVTNEKLTVNSVNTNNIVNNSINSNKIADNSIQTGHIADDTITSNKLVNNSIVTDKILNKNITEPKLADNCISNRTLQNNAVSTNKIQEGAVTINKIDGNLQQLIQAGTGLNPVLIKDIVNTVYPVIVNFDYLPSRLIYDNRATQTVTLNNFQVESVKDVDNPLITKLLINDEEWDIDTPFEEQINENKSYKITIEIQGVKDGYEIHSRGSKTITYEFSVPRNYMSFSTYETVDDVEGHLQSILTDKKSFNYTKYERNNNTGEDAYLWICTRYRPISVQSDNGLLMDIAGEIKKEPDLNNEYYYWRSNDKLALGVWYITTKSE